MPTASEVIKKPLARDRSKTHRGFTGQVTPEGGDRGAGLIEGFSVITLGEALGHGMWCDAEFLKQTHAAIEAAGESGVKCRFTHPGLSADGMGKLLGSIKNPKLTSTQVTADLHFSESAHKTPDGDLAEYVMAMAAEDPDKFGSSIVFQHDQKAAEIFRLENTNDETGDFISPDDGNTQNLDHCRLKKLYAADLVDDPAANPAGLFHRGQEIAQEATGLMEYALGLDGAEIPALAAFDVDPERMKSFLNRFMYDRGLKLTTIEKEPETMPKETNKTSTETSTETSAAPQPSRADFAAELATYVEKFGAENGGKWFSEGKTMEESLTAQVDLLNKQLTAQGEELAAANEKLAALNTGESEPFGSESGEGNKSKKFSDLVNIK